MVRKVNKYMMYPFMTLNDGTNIVHSEVLNIEEKELKDFKEIIQSLSHIIIELARDGGFDSDEKNHEFTNINFE